MRAGAEAVKQSGSDLGIVVDTVWPLPHENWHVCLHLLEASGIADGKERATFRIWSLSTSGGPCLALMF